MCIRFLVVFSILQFSFVTVFAQNLSSLCNGVIQSPVFGQAPKTYMSGEKLVEVLRPILRDRLAATNYDRIFPIEQFLNHYRSLIELDKNVVPFDALKSFHLNIYPEPLLSRYSGPCVGLTYDMLYHLPENIQGYIVAAMLPKKYQQFAFPEYCHTAVLIAFENPINEKDRGFILLDPSFDFYEPLLIRDKENVSIDLDDKGRWMFSLVEDRIICDILPQGAICSDPSLFRMIYRTDSLLNPVEASAIPMILADRRLSFLSRSSMGSHLAHLNIELDRERIIWDQEGERFDPISFKDFLTKKGRFFKEFSEKLYLDQEELEEKCINILLCQSIINQLHKQFLEAIYATRDFSITGELDLSELKNHIDRYTKSEK